MPTSLLVKQPSPCNWILMDVVCVSCRHIALVLQGLQKVLDAAASYSDMRIYRHKAVEFQGPAASAAQPAGSAAQASASQPAPQGPHEGDVFENELVKITPVILSYPRPQVGSCAFLCGSWWVEG